MLKAFESHIINNLSFLIKSKCLIAISGGLDSVVLTHLCSKLKFNIGLAHCNFNLRGAESDADESFVSRWAEDMDVELFIESFDTEGYAKVHQLSVQMAARELRYQWFEELLQQFHFDVVLTAHHADDNLETFLINLSRGTGLDGLIGIPEINDKVVRPLLPFSREQIEAYARENDLQWTEDSSNLSPKYLRNKFRLDVIPDLKETNPQFLQNFGKTQSYLQDSQEIIEDRMAEIQKKVVTIQDDLIKLDIKKLKKLTNPKTYLYHLLKEFNFTEWDDVSELLNAQSGKQVFSATHRLLKDRKHLLLTELGIHDHQGVSILDTEVQVVTPIGTLLFDEADALFGKRTNVIFVDKHKLNYPLLLRKWEEGDYFYPFGMKGKKKLSKYFKDEKLSVIDKEKTWVLCSGDDIVWVVGRRADDRYKVTENSTQILKIELNK